MDVTLLLWLHGLGIWGFGEEVKSWGAGNAGEPSPHSAAHPAPRAAKAPGLLLAPSLSPWAPKATPWAVPFLPFTPSRRQFHWEQPVCHHCDCLTPLEMATLARSVLVTGSNRGIGLELVRQLAASPRPPQHIFATCRDASGLRGKALQELAARHPSIKLIQLDTVDLPSIRGAMQTVETHLEGQGLNLLINNAGVGSQATLQSVDAQEMLATFAVNVVGPLQVAKVCVGLGCSSVTCNRGVRTSRARLKPRICTNRALIVSSCQEFLPLLEKAAKDAGTEGLSCSRAAIINVSSKVGSIGLCLGVLEAPMYPYRASKAAQNMVTRCLAEELRDKGILCAAIHPGWVKTDMGTEQAPMTVERSMQGILEVLGILSQETCGAFLDWEGNRLPW
ncbi:LOW QUALITY PROTEIN: uncharacterized oxidoreductase C663.09c-like [Phasianus colchicus]|uniref:LOW QUALITY PROTEIN: uncharacterized oxidoreductase C663.09c-like n=1 Tax=Phasianus colchicus TaxID=9054 RepID=UPI00129EAD87|nr:LOW QUALITY PROTEIN: uncharacterized oxidoreductase C663.09c-like [Phasianus colchicus]